VVLFPLPAQIHHIIRWRPRAQLFLKMIGFSCTWCGGSGMQKLSCWNYTTKQKSWYIINPPPIFLIIYRDSGFGRFWILPWSAHVRDPPVPQSLHSRLSRYLSPPLFPVLMRGFSYKTGSTWCGEQCFEIGPLPSNHVMLYIPGPHGLDFIIKGQNSVLLIFRIMNQHWV